MVGMSDANDLSSNDTTGISAAALVAKIVEHLESEGPILYGPDGRPVSSRSPPWADSSAALKCTAREALETALHSLPPDATAEALLAHMAKKSSTGPLWEFDLVDGKLTLPVTTTVGSTKLKGHIPIYKIIAWAGLTAWVTSYLQRTIPVGNLRIGVLIAESRVEAVALGALGALGEPIYAVVPKRWQVPYRDLSYDLSRVLGSLAGALGCTITALAKRVEQMAVALPDIKAHHPALVEYSISEIGVQGAVLQISDAEAGLIAGIPATDGICLHVSLFASVCVIVEGTSVLLGGWGRFGGPAPGSFWLASAVLTQLTSELDEGVTATWSSIRSVMPYSGGFLDQDGSFDRDVMAFVHYVKECESEGGSHVYLEIAQAVTELAGRGDPTALKLIDAMADELVEMVGRMLARHSSYADLPIVLQGQMFENHFFCLFVMAKLENVFATTVTCGDLDPVSGAAILANREEFAAVGLNESQLRNALKVLRTRSRQIY